MYVLVVAISLHVHYQLIAGAWNMICLKNLLKTWSNYLKGAYVNAVLKKY